MHTTVISLGLKRRYDAVLSFHHERCGGRGIKPVHLRVRFGSFREPAFDSGTRFCVSLSRSVADGFLKLAVLPLLPVPQNPRLPVHPAQLRRSSAAGHHPARIGAVPTERVRYVRHVVPVWHHSHFKRRRRNLLHINRSHPNHDQRNSILNFPLKFLNKMIGLVILSTYAMANRL